VLQGDPSHAALFAAINVTFVGFTGGDYYALEACGKCKHLQGGFHSFFRGIRFIQVPCCACTLPAKVIVAAAVYAHCCQLSICNCSCMHQPCPAKTATVLPHPAAATPAATHEQDGAPALASWSYPHQGIMKDTDGSLLRQYFGGQANGTLHAAHDMLRLQECTLVGGEQAPLWEAAASLFRSLPLRIYTCACQALPPRLAQHR
jgi:hypothetical protein